MSKETMLDLNTNTLVGFEDERGKAWHWRKEFQGSEPNHYPGAVPIEDVRRRLFNWKPVEGPVKTEFTVITEDGVETHEIIDPTRKTIIRPDLKTILGIFKQSYKIHDYDEWLIKHVELLLDSDLQIGSAGLLMGGAVAWVQIEVPETFVTPEGVMFRPHLLNATSLNGTLSTTRKRAITNTVCDNTMGAALREDGAVVKIRHSTNSLSKLAEHRAALDLVHAIGDDFAAHVAELTNTPVAEDKWDRFLKDLIPTPEKDGRGKTMATKKIAAMQELWNGDDRVAPWKNTAWGVVQAVNTYEHHVGIVRGTDRAERNTYGAITGAYDALDASTLERLAAV